MSMNALLMHRKPLRCWCQLQQQSASHRPWIEHGTPAWQATTLLSQAQRTPLKVAFAERFWNLWSIIWIKYLKLPVRWWGFHRIVSSFTFHWTRFYLTGMYFCIQAYSRSCQEEKLVKACKSLFLTTFVGSKEPRLFSDYNWIAV